jgi:hypothetical protein
MASGVSATYGSGETSPLAKPKMSVECWSIVRSQLQAEGPLSADVAIGKNQIEKRADRQKTGGPHGPAARPSPNLRTTQDRWDR